MIKKNFGSKQKSRSKFIQLALLKNPFEYSWIFFGEEQYRCDNQYASSFLPSYNFLFMKTILFNQYRKATKSNFLNSRLFKSSMTFFLMWKLLFFSGFWCIEASGTVDRISPKTLEVIHLIISQKENFRKFMSFQIDYHFSSLPRILPPILDDGDDDQDSVAQEGHHRKDQVRFVTKMVNLIYSYFMINFSGR